MIRVEFIVREQGFEPPFQRIRSDLNLAGFFVWYTHTDAIQPIFFLPYGLCRSLYLLACNLYASLSPVSYTGSLYLFKSMLVSSPLH